MAIGSNRSIRVSLATDNVFSDGSSQQLAILSGSLTDDLVAKLTIGI